MKICVPSESNQGLKSEVYGHFGSAPFFITYDTESKNTEIIINSNEHHEHGACNPVAAISGKGVDAVVCAGIGAGAMHKLNAAGIKVYCGDYKFAEDCVNAVIKKEAVEMTADKACGGHSCGHH